MASTVHGWYPSIQIKREIFAPSVMICLLEKHAFKPELKRYFFRICCDFKFLIHSLLFMTEFLLLHMCQFLIKLKIFHVCSMCNISFVLSFYLRILQYFVSLTKIGSKTLKDQWMEQGNNKKKKWTWDRHTVWTINDITGFPLWYYWWSTL